MAPFSTNAILILQVLLVAILIINSNIHFSAFPSIQQDLQTSIQNLQYSYVLNPFVAALTSYPFGRFADFYGRKPLLIGCISLFLIGSLICAISITIQTFFIGRLFQALSDAGIAVISAVIIGDYVQGHIYARWQGILSAICAIAWAAAPLLGAYFLSLVNWRLSFIFVCLLMVIVALPLVAWKPPYLIKQEHGSRDAKHLSNFAHKSFLIYIFTAAMPLGIFTAFILSSPFILMTHYHFTAFEYSYIMSVLIFVNILSSLTYAWIIRFLTFTTAFFIGFVLFLLYFGTSLMLLMIQDVSSPYFLVIAMGALVCSFPFIISTCTAKIVDQYVNQLGKALAFVALTRNLVSSSISFVCATYFQNTIVFVLLITLVPSVITIYLCLCALKELKAG